MNLKLKKFLDFKKANLGNEMFWNAKTLLSALSKNNFSSMVKLSVELLFRSCITNSIDIRHMLYVENYLLVHDRKSQSPTSEHFSFLWIQKFLPIFVLLCFTLFLGFLVFLKMYQKLVIMYLKTVDRVLKQKQFVH